MAWEVEGYAWALKGLTKGWTACKGIHEVWLWLFLASSAPGAVRPTKGLQLPTGTGGKRSGYGCTDQLVSCGQGFGVCAQQYWSA